MPVAALAAAMLVVAGPAPALAADTVTCGATGTIFGAETGGKLWRYPLSNPGGTTPVIAARTSAGGNWQIYGRVLGDPDGRVYGINAEGLWRYRWTGSAWENINNSPRMRIHTGFTQWAGASYRDKITVDERGDFFLIDSSGTLRTYRYDESTSTWTFFSRVLDTGWGRFNLIVAAGAGVLHARDATTGDLYRFRYEADSQRWVEHSVRVSGGWQTFTKGIFSVGGDTLMGIKADGVLSFYRFREDNRTWVVHARILGNGGWQNFGNVFAVTNTCKLTVSHVPARPAVTVAQNATTAVTQLSSRSIEFAHTDNIGRLMHARTAADNLTLVVTPISGSDGFSGVPALSETTANLSRVTAHNVNSDIWTRVQSSAGSLDWGAWSDIGGRMASAPAVVRLSSQREVVFAVDGAGALWARRQDAVLPDLLAWRKLGGTALTGTPVAVPLADAAAMVFATNTSGALQMARYSAGTLGAWKNLGGSGISSPVSVVTLPGYQVRLFARDAAGQVVTLASDAAGTFPGTWTTVGTTEIAPSGRPSAVLSPVTGRIAVFVRAADGNVRYAGETAQGSGVWGSWINAQSESDSFVTDPAAFGFFNVNGANMAYVARTAALTLRLYTVEEPRV